MYQENCKISTHEWISSMNTQFVQGEGKKKKTPEEIFFLTEFPINENNLAFHCIPGREMRAFKRQ